MNRAASRKRLSPRTVRTAVLVTFAGTLGAVALVVGAYAALAGDGGNGSDHPMSASTKEAPEIPNHVDSSEYSAQAMGATAMVEHLYDANGPDPHAYVSGAVRVGDKICVDLRAFGQGPQSEYCNIPANGTWPAPVIATILELQGTRYVVGVASDQANSIDMPTGAPITLSTHEPFPTIEFFAQPITGSGPVQLVVTTKSDRTLTVTASAAPG